MKNPPVQPSSPPKKDADGKIEDFLGFPCFKMPVWWKMNLITRYFGAELRDFSLDFPFFIVVFLCLKKEMITKSIIYSCPPPLLLSQKQYK